MLQALDLICCLSCVKLIMIHCKEDTRLSPGSSRGDKCSVKVNKCQCPLAQEVGEFNLGPPLFLRDGVSVGNLTLSYLVCKRSRGKDAC